MEEFVARFAEVAYRRQGNARHNLNEILLIALCTMLCAGVDCSDTPLSDNRAGPLPWPPCHVRVKVCHP